MALVAIPTASAATVNTECNGRDARGQYQSIVGSGWGE